MRRIAVDFYTDQYSECECNSSYLEEMLRDLLRLETAQAESINSYVTPEELTTAAFCWSFAWHCELTS